MQDQLARVSSWVGRTQSGDIAELDDIPEDAALWPLVTSTADSVLSVPLQALVLRELGKGESKQEYEGIFTVKDGRSDFVPVNTGISDDMNIEIFETLGEDIPIVIGPFRTLRDLEDSTKVKIVKERDDLS